MEFQSLYWRYKDKIYNYLYYRVGFDKSVAEDLTSTVFLSAYESFEDFDQSRPFQPWIYRIAHNLLVNHYRQTKPQVSWEDLQGMEIGIIDDSYSLEGEIDQKIVIEQLNELSPRDAELLTMRYLQELSYSEIAESLEDAEGTVRTATHRAINKLGKLINQKSHE